MTNLGTSGSFSRHQLKRLADLAMQQGTFFKASALYTSILRTYPCDGDIAHARAASYLGMASSLSFADKGHCHGNFIQAQRLWKDAGSITECATHPSILTQLQKQLVYGSSFDSLDKESGEDRGRSNIVFASHLGGKCFVTNGMSPILSQKECQKVIDAAEGHAVKVGKEGNNGGWTTSRHYAVPTTDIPLHEVTELHPWFYQHLWQGKIRPLLRRQFKLTSPPSLSTEFNCPNRDIFLHDMFVGEGNESILCPLFA
jgi:hypothetical protein